MYNAIKHYEKTQSFESITRKRSRITSQRTDKLIVEMSRSDPFLTAPRIREKNSTTVGTKHIHKYNKKTDYEKITSLVAFHCVQKKKKKE